MPLELLDTSTTFMLIFVMKSVKSVICINYWTSDIENLNLHITEFVMYISNPVLGQIYCDKIRRGRSQ